MFNMRFTEMKYGFMLFIAFVMAIMSSLLTAFGMADLFSGVGKFILFMFVAIDLGRFLLFNFLIDEWNNLRKVKYLIVFILCCLFIYSGIGVFAKMSSLVSSQVEEAIINITSMAKATQNANIKHNRSEDMAAIAQAEYKNALSWNETDYQNCLKRAGGNARFENNCNNTKRRLDKTALTTLETALREADDKLSQIEETTLVESKNKSQVSSVLLTVCRVSQRKCDNYDDLQFALSIIIFLVIVGTDYLQIAIVLAVNTRKNKELVENDLVEETKIEESKITPEYKIDYTFQPLQTTPIHVESQQMKVALPEVKSQPVDKNEQKPAEKKPKKFSFG